MILKEARVQNYKSIEDSTIVSVEEKLTVLLGKNESGKTAFLEALLKTNSNDPRAVFDETKDYPRKNLVKYKKEKKPALVTELRFELRQKEIDEINKDLGFKLLEKFSFILRKFYDQNISVDLNLPEQSLIDYYLLDKTSVFTLDNKENLSHAKSLKELIKILETLDLNQQEQELKRSLEERFSNGVPEGWDNLLNWYIWNQHLAPNLPQFIYFSDYQLLPDQVNLDNFYQKFKSNSLGEEDRSVLNLLEIANIQVEDLLDAETSYEDLKAELESVSIEITDRIFGYWKQDPDLDVEFDMKPDHRSKGTNLYIRIKNKRHRVTVPFQQRSRGFIWFFSFITLFDCIKRRTNNDLIILLDEPGLNLHGLAQKDLADYIREISEENQVIYTTHSSYMIDTDFLKEVRAVFDYKKTGTSVQDNLSGSPVEALTPIRTSLGSKIIHSFTKLEKVLFFTDKVDYFYLKFFSNCLCRKEKIFLNPEINLSLIPELILNQVHLDLINPENYSLKNFELKNLFFREMVGFENQTALGKVITCTIEDLISPDFLIQAVNEVFFRDGFTLKNLPKPNFGVLAEIKKELENYDPKVELTKQKRLEVAKIICSRDLDSFDEKTYESFEKLISEVNSLFLEEEQSKKLNIKETTLLA